MKSVILDLGKLIEQEFVGVIEDADRVTDSELVDPLHYLPDDTSCVYS
jgi:hypothetical protein